MFYTSGGESAHRPERALPGYIRDLIVEGVPAAELRAGGDKTIFNALVRTACSAINCGHTRIRWEEQLAAADSTLGLQARRDRRKVKRPNRAITRILDQAWAAAEQLVQDAAWTKAEVREEVKHRTAALDDLIADPDAPLTDADRLVLAHLANEAERRGMLRVALPRQQVVRATGLKERTVRHTLAQLSKTPLLKVFRAGKPTATPVYAGQPSIGFLPLKRYVTIGNQHLLREQLATPFTVEVIHRRRCHISYR